MKFGNVVKQTVNDHIGSQSDDISSGGTCI